MKVYVLFANFCVMLFMFMITACHNDPGGSNNLTPSIIVSEASHDFSGIVLNNSADHTFEIRNAGDANLNIGQISVLAAPYSIPAASDACSNRSLTPSGICTFEARFEPTNQGTFEDHVSIPSNDPGGTKRIDLSGEGYGLNVWIKESSTDPGCIVNVGVTVTNDAGDILNTSDLDPSTDFFFYVDETQVAPENVIFDTYDVPAPVSVVLAIDSSESELGVLPEIKDAAKSFINKLDDTYEAAICSFNNGIEFDPMPDSTFYDLATNRQDLIDYINTLASGNKTFLYDAVYEAVDRAADGSATNIPLVVVMSDGVDNGSDRTFNQIVAHAQDRGIAIFTIYYRDPLYEGGDYGDPNTLVQLSNSTGGQAFDGTTGGLDVVYDKVIGTIQNMFKFKLTIPACTSGPASLDVLVDTGVLHGKDSTTITFP